jgi:ABC-type dipeptide/oligopeptide/nickel transport system permease subunit
MAQLAARPALSVSDRLKESLFYFPLLLGGAILVVLVLVVLFGPLVAPHNPYLIDRLVVPHYDFESETYIRVPVEPGAEFPLGTDERGMDIVSLLLFGARTTVIAGVLVAALRIVIGLAAGMVMGWNENKWIDRLLQGVINVITSVPALVAAMILIYSFGIKGGMATFVAALTIVGWTEVAQYMRSEVLVLRKMPFIEGARVVGASDTEMLLRHVFPNILPQLFVTSFLEIGSALMLVGELALVGVFIGGGSTLDLSDLMAPPTIVGIPTHPEWGASVASGFRWFRSYPHVVMMPALAIFLAVLGFNSFGEGLRAFFEKRGVKATFLLGKRLLYAAGAVALVIYLVLNGTRPSLWFKEMAEGFQSTRMQADQAAVAPLWGGSPDAENVYPAARWLGDAFHDQEFSGGIRWSNPVYARRAEVFDASAPATLQLLDASGAVSAEFSGADEVAYIVEDYGAAGSVTAPLQALVFPFNYYDTFEGQLQEIDVAGHIVLLMDDNAPPWVGGYLVQEKSAAGVIWIGREGAELENSPLHVIPKYPPEDPHTVPALRVSAAVGASLVDAARFPAPEALESLDLGTARISVQLAAAHTIDLNSVVTFRPGTDADLGDEIVLIYAFCDGLSPTPVAEASACPSAYMLELARLLNENLIDTRRPIVFVVWGGGEYGRGEFTQWILNPDSYSITAPGMRISPHVTIAIQLVGKSEGSELAYSEGTSPDFVDVLRSASRELDQPIQEVPASEVSGWPLFPVLEVPFQAQLQVNTSGDAETQKRQGEALAFTLIRLMREDVLAAD